MSSGYNQQGFKPNGQYSGFNGVNSLNGIQNGGVYGSGAKPIFESVNNFEPSGPNGFGASGFDGSSFHSTNPDFYKKALKGSSGINSLNSFNGGGYNGNYAASSNYHEAARQDNIDCVCVPYDQCPARDVLGRKGDLILPLDPRNLGTDIEALTDDNNSTTNGTVTRVTKESNDDNLDDISIETVKEDIKHVTKREAAAKNDEIQKSDGEAVSVFYLYIYMFIIIILIRMLIFDKN